MLGIKRGFAVALLGGVLAALGIAMPAAASTTATCAIQGNATASVQWVGGSGSYTFTSFTAVCAAANPAAKVPSDVATLSISSSGSFNNTSCGTGDATDDTPGVTVTNDTASTNNADTSYVTTLNNTDLGYKVTFTDGQGTLNWENANAAKTNKVKNLPNASAGGVVSIQPTSPQDPPPPAGSPSGICTKGFAVEGVVGGSVG